MNRTHFSPDHDTHKRSVCNISPNNINDNTNHNHNRHNNNNSGSSSSISVAVSLVVHTYHFSVSIWIPVQCVYFVSAYVFVHVWEWFIFHILPFSSMCLALSLCVRFAIFSVRWKDYFIECVTKNGTSRRYRYRLRSRLCRCLNDHSRARTSLYRWAIGGHLLNVYCNMTTSWYIVVNTLQ